MTLTSIAAWLYAITALGPIAMQVALFFGAPLGKFAMGGKWKGAVPRRVRPLLVAQILILAAMALTVLAAAGEIGVSLPGWTLWVVIALTTLTCIANWITPSVPERMIWGPATTEMLMAVLIVAFL